MVKDREECEIFVLLLSTPFVTFFKHLLLFIRKEGEHWDKGYRERSGKLVSVPFAGQEHHLVQKKVPWATSITFMFI